MSEENRPNPEDLLKAINLEETKSKKGRLKIFLGMAAGVGKTFAMLEDAHKVKALGANVQVGIVETHGRDETAKLLEGMVQIPLEEIRYRDKLFKELNLDLILKVKPQLVLVDELAHTNIPGSRHPKRWQDVVEIIENGIDVYSTLNVQHIESLRDHVESVAEISIRETVPDLVIELADSIELIDITPSELLQRLKEGKVYLGERSEFAAQHFFKEDRLAALREMALRFAAEKVDHDLKGMVSVVERPFGWKTRERLLVAVSPHEHSQKLIRTTRRLAFNLNAPWIAVYVNNGKFLSEEEKATLDKNLSVARDLGAEVVTASDPSIARAIQHIARQRGVTQIVIGRPPVHKFLEFFYRPTLLDQLTDLCEDIDIHVIRRLTTAAPIKNRFWSMPGASLATFAAVFLLVGLLALLNWFLDRNLWIYASLYTSLALVLASIANWSRNQRYLLAKRESSALALFKISHEIASAPSSKLVLPAVERQLSAIFDGLCEIIIKKIDNGLDFDDTGDIQNDEKEQAVCTWVFENETEAGWSTSTLPASRYFHLPLKGYTQVVGVLAFRSHKDKKLSLEIKNFLYTAGFQIATHIERSFAQKKNLEVEQLNQKEKIYYKILDVISEQFKIPMETISKSVSKMADQDGVDEIRKASAGLMQILDNISAMTKLRSGLGPIHRDSHLINEVIEASLENTHKAMGLHKVKVNIQEGLPKMDFDFYLIEILICNLLFNAIENRPPQMVVQIDVWREDNMLIVAIGDEDKGHVDDRVTGLFEKFYRPSTPTLPTLGMGLSIAKTIAEVHEGTLTVDKLASGRSRFNLHIPIKKDNV